MAARDDKKDKPAEPRPEEVTLNAHGYAATAPITEDPAAPAALPSGPRLGDGEVVAGRYRVTRFVAAGGMGEVYEAEDLELGERVALKTIRETSDPGAEERFKREIQLSRKVTHPNVCRIFDVGYHTLQSGERFTFLTMELLGGETLLDQIRRDGPVALDEAARIVRQVAAALTAAHAAGVVHRDLKSGNVIIAPKKGGGTRAVVTDFGLAHVLGGGEDRGRSLSGSGGIVGTPGYMAPEQVEGGELSPRTDLYALGIVMYEMVTGKLPFEGATPLSIAAKRLTTPAPSPRVLRPDLPARWERAIGACLQRDPAARPIHARAVLDLLEEESGSTSLRFAKLDARPRWLQAAVVIMLALAAALAVRAWQNRRRSLEAEIRERGLALAPFTAAQPGGLASYGVLIRNAVRTDLAFDLPVIDARSELHLPDGRVLAIGHARPRSKGREPLRVDGRYTVTGEGADRQLQLTLAVVDPRTDETRAKIVENGSLRHLAEVVLHAGDRLRAMAGIDAARQAPISARGREAFEAGMEGIRTGNLAVALERVEQGLIEDRGSVELRFLLSRVLAGLELDVSSQVAIQRTAALGPSADAFWRRRVEALRLRHDATRSVSVLEQLYRDNPTNFDLAIDLAHVYIQAQRGPDSIKLLDELAHKPLGRRDRLRIGLARLVVAERMTRHAEVMRDYVDLQKEARELKLPGLEVAVLRAACSVLEEVGAYAQTDAVCGELRALAERLSLPFGIVMAEIAWPGVRCVNDRGPLILDRARQARALAEQLGGRRRLAEALNVFATAALDAYAEEGSPEHFKEALAIAEDAHDYGQANAVLGNLAYYALLDGQLGEERRYRRHAVEWARDSGSRDMLGYAECSLGIAECRLGDFDAARRLLAEAEAAFASGAAQVLSDDDCTALRATIAGVEDRLGEAYTIYNELANQRGKRGSHTAMLEARRWACESLMSMSRWDELLACTSQLISDANKAAEHGEMRQVFVLRAIAQAELGDLREARALPAFVRELDDADTKLDRTWLDLLLARLDRRLGVSAADLGPRIDAVIGAAATMEHRMLELEARLERLRVLQRDHAPSEAAERKELIERAQKIGYLWIARQAARSSGRGR